MGKSAYSFIHSFLTAFHSLKPILYHHISLCKLLFLSYYFTVKSNWARRLIQGEFISMLYSRALILRNYCNKDINIFCSIYYLDFAIFTGTHYLTIYSWLWAQFTYFLSPPLFPSCLDTSLYHQPITASSAWIMKQCSKATVPARFHELDNWQMVC